MNQTASAAHNLRVLRVGAWALVTALSLLPGPVMAAPGKLEGFLGLKWGDTEARATTALNQHFRFVRKANGSRTFMGTFAGYPASWVYTYAKKDRVYGVRVVLGTPSGKDPFALHKEVADQLKQKYGTLTNATFVRGDQSKGDYDDLALSANRTDAKSTEYDGLVRDGGGCYGTNWYFDDGNAVTLRLQRIEPGRPPVVTIDYWSVKTQQALETSTATEL